MSISDVLQESPLRHYDRRTSVVFLKTKEAFGGLSNMAGGFPIRVNGVRVLTSEALYQACRFPHRPEIQRLIIEQTSPMTAKMKGKPHRDDTRPDWDSVRVRIMRWCLRAKLVQNFGEFSRLLLATGMRPIVEESRKDDFWGAKPDETGGLLGQNVLGRLLMELREEVKTRSRDHWDALAPLSIPNFWFLGEPMPAIESASRHSSGTGRTPVAREQLPVPSEARGSEPAAQPIVNEAKKVNLPRKKLIEVSIPLEAINVASAREKSIRHRHPSTLHLWWARRPLAACRAVLFAQLVDDPSAWPGRYPFPAIASDEEAERKRLHRIIERMVPWEASNDEAILNEARWEIARSVAWGLGEEPPAREDGRAILDYLQTKAPPVYDPFSGGGSIPLEAQRLGLRAYGSDLNPVAVVIGKALVEIPPKFAGLPPVNPRAREEAMHGQLRAWKGAQGLAEDVRYYGQWMRDEAELRIGHLYPKATLPDGSQATVIAWLWARTVRSPDPAAKRAMVPLVSSFMLSTKEGKKAWVEPIIDPTAEHGWRFEIKSGPLLKSDEEKLKLGTKGGKAQAFVCLLTGAAIERTYIQAEGKADRLGERLMAIVADGPRGRLFLEPNPVHENLGRSAPDNQALDEARATFLSPPTPTRAMITGGVCSAYGLRTYGHLFTARQTIALLTLCDLVEEVKRKVISDLSCFGFSDDPAPLHAGGAGDSAYADAISTYLAFMVTQLANHSSTLCGWNSANTQMRSVFARQAMPMTWDFAEVNVFSESSGSYFSLFDRLKKAFTGLPETTGLPAGGIYSLDAAKNSYPERPFVVCTDPPYYDNIGYADLSDFFYVWLRQPLGHIWPDLFRRLTTPKEHELVATSYRFSGSDIPDWVRDKPNLSSRWTKLSPKDRAEAFFMAGMSNALVAMRDASTHTDPLVIYYAFKQSEIAEDGITSAGWASFLQAIVDSGLGIDGTWPLDTEKKGRSVEIGANALASSVVLVCRKRVGNAHIITRSEFLRTLKREMPEAVDKIRRAGVGPVDMPQSVIGPGMGVFTRHAQVLEDDDSPMSVKIALALINRVWGEIENDLDANFDAETQVALAWFSTYGFDARSSGDLINLATAKNISIESLFRSGVFENLHGKAGLIPRERLDHDWSPATDKTVTVWECVQHTARVLRAEDGGAEAAARLVAAMGPKAEDARALAYRLYEIASQKAWAAEALVYNELAQEWAHLDTLATTIAKQPRHAEREPDLVDRMAR
ncbi:MAG: DUF1156 domain-containing protein [Acetobacteraceae bacterium]